MLQFLKSIEDEMEIKTFHKGYDLLTYFNKTKNIGFIESGKAKVYYESLDGKTLFLNVLNKGDVVGVLSALSNDVRTEIIAANEITLKVVKEEYMHELFNNLEFNKRYTKLLNNKVNFLVKKIQFLTTADVRLKLLKFLLDHEEDGKVTLDMSKSDLIYYLNISKASLFNELSRLRNQEVIDYKNREIVIKNKRKIIEYMEEFR